MNRRRDGIERDHAALDMMVRAQKILADHAADPKRVVAMMIDGHPVPDFAAFMKKERGR
jgi:hypothetical protein